jgi:hypothetical protein
MRRNRAKVVSGSVSPLVSSPSNSACNTVMEPIRTATDARDQQKVAQLCSNYFETMQRLTPLQVHTIRDHVLRTAMDIRRAPMGAAEFDSLEIAWVVLAMHSEEPLEEEKAPEPLGAEWLRPDQFALTFVSPAEMLKQEYHTAVAILSGEDMELLHQATRGFVWYRYLTQYVDLDRTLPCEKLLESQDDAVGILRQRLQQELGMPVHGEGLFDIAMPLIRGAFGWVGCVNAFRRRQPKQRDNMSLSDALQYDLRAHVDEIVTLNEQSQLRPSIADHWQRMIPRVQENWYLSMFMYRFNQDSTVALNKLEFRHHYLVHWSDIGTVEAEVRFRRRTLSGRPARPLLVHLGDQAWCVWDRRTRTTYCRTGDVVHALAAWTKLTWTDYGGTLENGARIPRFSMCF